MKEVKDKKCKCGCGESFKPYGIWTKGIYPAHWSKWLSTTEAGAKEIEKIAARAKKKVEADAKKKEREKTNELLPIVHEKKYKGLFQMEINRLSRMIDAKFGFTHCIDCGKIFGNQIDAAHFTSVGANNSTRYNLHNLHSAKSDCNQYSDKHKQGYTLGLEKRYGKEYLEMVEALPLTYKYIKVTPQEVFEKLKLVRSIIRNFDTYKLESSIQARTLFNNIIGIYLENN